eukprot:CAMPEP_0201687562 /NCGR_PEP_ID=MMETSP0578-20130828/1567_1 /ASSEMBLY_ACC=CAM_ASM_000663 /TAXON_ID=267565 /ORGANISM="Skeletonema grethea, Strain CCMP 1804" /LENGTH=623 /DNA_ID=CAMNT_0048171725 /DNA_START=51 /DNA_END=1919 /DNA_ORIENTATION=+
MKEQQQQHNIAMPPNMLERLSSCDSFSTRKSSNFHSQYSIDIPQDNDHYSGVTYDLAENAYIPYSTVQSSGPPSLPLKFPEPTANKAITVSTDVIDHTTQCVFRASNVMMRRPNHCKSCDSLTPQSSTSNSPTSHRANSSDTAQFSAFNTPRAPVAGASSKKPQHSHKRTSSNTPLRSVPCGMECDLPDVAYCVRRKICETTYGSIKLCVVLKRVNRNMGNVKTIDQNSGFDTIRLDQVDQSVAEDPTWETTDEVVAVKVINLAKYRSFHGRSLENPVNELAALELLGNYHPNIICLVDALQNDTHLFIVTPYISGGDLPSRIVADMENSPSGRVHESQAKIWFQQLLSAISHLQKKGVCHRDLCMNNIMVDEYGDLCILDFGLCLRVPFVDPNNRHLVTDVSADTSRRLMKAQGQVGSRAYMAPEVALNMAAFDGFAVDLWSAGILLFEILVGKKPFAMPDPNDINFRRISIDRDLGGFLQAKNIHLDASIVNLLQKMLLADPEQRLTLSEIVEHPWLRGSLSGASPEPSVANRMSSWFVANDAIDDAGDMNLSQFNRLRADTTSTIFTLEKEMIDFDENTVAESCCEDRTSPFSDILAEGEETERSFKPKAYTGKFKARNW